MTDSTIKKKHPPRIVPEDYVQERLAKLLTNSRNKYLNKLLKKLIDSALTSGDIDTMKLILATAQGQAKSTQLKKGKAIAAKDATTPVASPTQSNDLLARLKAPATSTPANSNSGSQTTTASPETR